MKRSLPILIAALALCAGGASAGKPEWTIKGASRRARSAPSTKVTLGRSPQCRPSSTSITGCAAHSAPRKSQNARCI